MSAQSREQAVFVSCLKTQNLRENLCAEVVWIKANRQIFSIYINIQHRGRSWFNMHLMQYVKILHSPPKPDSFAIASSI